MKKIIVVHGFYGHVELVEDQTVEKGVYKGLNKEQLLERITRTGKIEYDTEGGGAKDAVAVVTRKDGSITTVRGGHLGGIAHMDDVDEVAFLAPLAGG